MSYISSSDSYHTAEGNEDCGEDEDNGEGLEEVDGRVDGGEDDSFVFLRRHQYNPDLASDSDSDQELCSRTILNTTDIPNNWKQTNFTVLKYVDDFLGIEKVCTATGIRHLTQNKMHITSKAIQSQHFFDTIEQNATSIGMSVNAQKTQMLCVSSSLHANNETYISVGLETKQRITNTNHLKILGFIFGNKPDISAQYDSMLLKFRRRVWVLRHLKKAKISDGDLLKLYQSLVLPVLDYTAVVYHSMLSKTQEQGLENLQIWL